MASMTNCSQSQDRLGHTPNLEESILTAAAFLCPPPFILHHQQLTDDKFCGCPLLNHVVVCVRGKVCVSARVFVAFGRVQILARDL